MPSQQERRLQLAEAWLAATGLITIIVIGRTDGRAPVLPTFGDPLSVRRTVARNQHDFEMPLVVLVERWCLNVHVANGVFSAAFGDVPRVTEMGNPGWVALDADQARRQIETAAQRGQVTLKSAAEVVEQSLSAADVVMAKAEEMRRNGELAGYNAAYKTYRMERAAKGDSPVMSYEDWMQVMRLRAAETAGAKVRQTIKFSTG